MAITGYFVDIVWVYREVLLGFRPLYGAHISAKLSNVLLKTLTDHDLEARSFGLTTDNAPSNETLFDFSYRKSTTLRVLVDDVEKKLSAKVVANGLLVELGQIPSTAKVIIQLGKDPQFEVVDHTVFISPLLSDTQMEFDLKTEI